MWAAATGKARLPTIASLTGGTTRRLVPAERNTCNTKHVLHVIAYPQNGDRILIIDSVTSFHLWRHFVVAVLLNCFCDKGFAIAVLH